MSKTLIIPICIFFTFVIFALKINFEYYHFLYPVGIIFLLFYKISLFKRNNIAIAVISTIILTNVLIIFLSDSYVYKVLFDKYYWSENELKVSDFQGEVDENIPFTAIVDPYIQAKVNRVFNFPPAILFTTNDRDKAWIRINEFNDSNEDQKSLKRLLKHEKRHIDIMEIYRRMAVDSLNETWFLSYDEKVEIIQHFYDFSDSIQDVFDLETEHGRNIIKTNEWNKRLDDNLLK